MIQPVTWIEDRVEFLDQTKLPNEESTFVAHTSDEVAEAISSMIVRGAPAIGISAAYGFALAWLEHGDSAAFEDAVNRLAVARPTAVNLMHGIKFMQQHLQKFTRMGTPNEKISELLIGEALGYHEADIAMNQEIGARGLEAILGIGPEDPRPEALGQKLKVITHCNTGSLATGGYGTALGIIRTLHKKKCIEEVFACETRPFLQGARLTAYELSKDNIPYKLLTDNMAAWLMQTEKIDAIVVGADRIARNGDTANKIGTLALAILAKQFKVPFYVAAPTTTIDLELADGSQIPVEERDKEEVLGYRNTVWAPEDAVAWNPAFDITPADLITGIVTEKFVWQPNDPDFPEFTSEAIL
jgi:methylthioribose-1-phosphate isomerase